MHQPISQGSESKSAVLLLTGFLGAGKTTLLKRILAWQSDLSDTVVLVNEFGDVGIDGDLLKKAGSDVVELTSGCICCTLSIDLAQSLAHIRETYQPRQIFIEASGVADPNAIVTVLGSPQLAEHMTLEKVVTVLDADLWEARENFGRLFFKQLEMAHLILLNKVDQVDPSIIPLYLQQIHETFPGCRVMPTIRCAIDPGVLWTAPPPAAAALQPMHVLRPFSTGDCGGDRQSGVGPHSGRPHPTVETKFVTFSFESDQIMEKDRFRHFIETLPWEVFRLKGSVRFSDHTAFINHVGGKSEWSEWEGEPGTRLAFIGWEIAPAELRDQLKGCVI